MVQGGWEFIYAAYGAVWLVLGWYGLSLWIRFRNVKKREGELS